MEKKPRKQIHCICDGCGTTYLKDESEYNRNLRIGRKSFCNRICTGKNNQGNLGKYWGDTSNLKRSNPTKDKFTGFRDFLRRARNRLKDKNEEILSLEEIYEIWQKQQGKCVYSHVELTLPKIRTKNNPIYTASLDRIDNSKRYTKDNVQFVSIIMNHMRNNMTHEEMLEAIKIIRNT